MSCTECVRFEQKLAFHTAPALLGIKAANLVSLIRTDFNIYENIAEFNAKVVSKGLEMKVFCECGNRVLALVYNKKLLKELLSQESKRTFLKNYGYGEDFSVEECLERLATRVSEEKQFPHEIGIFLGYPVEDVIGFIENNGANFKFCGYWKVYGNVEKAKHMFENYNRCRNFLCNKLNQGFDIYQALKIS